MASGYTIKFNREIIFTALIYIALFLFCLYPYTDYDWGWHYKYGEYFFKNGQLLMSDPFSWSMAGYQWVNHEWLYDLLLYTLFNAVSFTGLSIIGAAIAVLTFHFAIRGIKVRFLEKGVLAFFYGYLISGVLFQSIRSQVIGLLFMALTMYFVRLCFQKNKKILLVFPPFFLLWANLHGTFAFGLLIVALALGQSFIYSLEKKSKGTFVLDKYVLLFGLSFIVSVAVTFINPYTYHVYLEVLRHFSNPLLPLITEWTPVRFPSMFYFMVVAFTALLVTAISTDSWKKPYYRINFFGIIIFLFTFFLALGARRYVAIFMVVNLGFIALYFQNLNLNFERFRTASLFMIVALLIALQIGVHNRVVTKNLFTYNYSDYCMFGSSCSEKFMQYAASHPPQGKGFNFYDWGGYLIGRGFPTKLFIDGRMHLWKAQNGYSPMSQYASMYYDGNIALFKSYKFDWLLLATNSPINRLVEEGKAGSFTKKFEDGYMVYYVKKTK